MVSSLGEIQIAKFMKLINSPQIATYPRCIILTLSKIKDKERKLKAAIEKKKSHIQEDIHKAVSEFLSKILEARNDWGDIFEVMKEKNANQKYFIH